MYQILQHLEYLMRGVFWCAKYLTFSTPNENALKSCALGERTFITQTTMIQNRHNPKQSMAAWAFEELWLPRQQADKCLRTNIYGKHRAILRLNTCLARYKFEQHNNWLAFHVGPETLNWLHDQPTVRMLAGDVDQM